MEEGELPGCPIRFGVFEADLQSGEVRKHGIRIKLRDQPFQILTLLLEHPGQVVTREELQRRLWAADTFVDFDRGLNRAVNQLREALGDSADNPRFIETLPKRGYRFVAPVDSPPATPEPAEPVRPPEIPAPAVRPRFGRWLLASTAVLLVCVAGAWLYSRRARPVAEPNTIVLMEIDNLTGDPAFDATIKQALQMDLEQSPFLRILSDQEAGGTLRLMGRSPEQRPTLAVAREVCLRAGGKAVLGGSVARLGREYVVNLNAVNCETGETLAQQQVRAAAKEDVLPGLDTAASELRGKLGESLASIRRYERPLSDFGVSTSSLEAFQAYTVGQRMVNRKGRPYGIAFYRRAAELDPNFALAYMQMGMVYNYLGETKLAAENVTKAYALRDRVSESERFFISVEQYLDVTGQLDKVPPVCQVWIQSYPRDRVTHDRAGWAYTWLGQYENALPEAQQAYRMRGDLSVTLNLLARITLYLDRVQEARAIFQKAYDQNPDQLFWRQGTYLLAFLDGDTKRMEEQVAWALKTPGSEDHLLAMHAATNAYFGHSRTARELTRQAADFAQRAEFRERASLLMAREALREAWFGYFDAAIRQARAAVAMVPGRDVRALAALALARSGEVAEARKLSEQLDAEFPLSTLIHGYWLPAIQAEIEVHDGNYSRAVELLRAALPYELADTPSPLTPVYIRAEALLRAGQGAVAAGEFQKILQHRGLVANSPLGSLARFGLAQAYSRAGQAAKARAEYDNFLALWKDADPDIPILQQARAAYPKTN
jgi:DNA-binding winged helix-turn-helix (wHTH) protein/tetratricopeptide (TPR) repeat protein